MLDLVVATNDDSVLARNLQRSPLLGAADVELHIKRGYASAGGAYNDAMAGGRHEVMVFVHQDVYIPSGWQEHLMRGMEVLEHADPSWAVLGVYGVTAGGVHVGYVWSSGLNSVLGQPFDQPRAVVSVDELLIAVRRSAGIRFDEALPGFHLYGTDIVQTALNSGKGAYAICAPVVHNSRPVAYLPADYFRAYDYVASKWRVRLPIPNCVAPVVSSRATRWGMRARQVLGRLRFAGRDRVSLDRQLDCVRIAKRVGFEPACVGDLRDPLICGSDRRIRRIDR